MPETRISELLHTVDERFAAASGEAFFRQTVRDIARALSAPCVFAATFDHTRHSATVLALWMDDHYESVTDYSLDGTPCERVSRGEVTMFRLEVDGSLPYPLAWFEQRGLDSYLAVPVRRGGGEVGGHVAVMDKGDRHWNDTELDVLRVHALCAGSALERAAWEARAQRSNDALGHFSHELRTPLNAILGYTQLLLRDPSLSPQHREQLEVIRGAGARLVQRVGEVMALIKAEAGTAADTTGAAAPALPAPVAISGAVGRRRRILIAEDDQPSRELLAQTLESAGFDCTRTRDGADAIDALQRARFDMIITDLNMPRVDGFGVLKAARAQQPALPVLALSANTPGDFQQRATAAGFTDFIAKPWALERLFQSIAASLGVGGLRASRQVTDATPPPQARSNARALEPALLATLYHHAKAGDVQALLNAIDSGCGPAGDHPLGDELRRLTRNYDLRSVRRLLEPLLNSAGYPAGPHP